MALKLEYCKFLTQVVLALAGLGAISPMAFATITASAQAQLPVNQPLANLDLTTELPFVGTRFFNFMGGTGTTQSIEISSDGTTTVQLHGLYDSHIQYSGPFTNPITLDDGQRLRIEGNKIFQLVTDEATEHSCRGDQTFPCEAILRELFSDFSHWSPVP